MKKNKKLLLLCFLITQMFFAQHNENKIFIVNQVLNITSATNSQTIALKNAFNKRKDSLENADSQKKIRANKNYYLAIEEIFNEPQKKIIFESMINMSHFNNQINSYINQLDLENYPSGYKEIIKQKISKIKLEKEKVKLRYAFENDLKELKLNLLQKEISSLITEDSKIFRKLNLKWNEKYANCNSLNNNEKKDYFDYQFLALKKSDSIANTNEINGIISKPNFNNMISKLAKCDCEYLISKKSILKERDSLTEGNFKTNLIQIISEKYSAKITSKEPLEYKGEELNFNQLSKQYVNDYNLNNNSEETIFLENAEKIGLSNDKKNALVVLIRKRNEDIHNFKMNKKTKENSSSLTDNNNLNKPSQINKEFNRKIAELISIDEYSKLFGKNFNTKAKEEAMEQFKIIDENYSLTKEQKATIYKMVEKYHYNLGLYDAYYNHDKNILKKKLATLKFYFEKEYKNLMTSYGKKVENINKDKKFEF